MGKTEKIVCSTMIGLWCGFGGRAVYASALAGDWLTAATVFMACAGMVGANVMQLRGAKIVWEAK